MFQGVWCLIYTVGVGNKARESKRGRESDMMGKDMLSVDRYCVLNDREHGDTMLES